MFIALTSNAAALLMRGQNSRRQSWVIRGGMTPADDSKVRQTPSTPIIVQLIHGQPLSLQLGHKVKSKF
jgi:hypothetical protein